MSYSMYNRVFQCKHCGCDYTPKRSDQKFCSASHRSAYHQMNKRPNKKQLNGNLNNSSEVNLSSKKDLLLTSALGSLSSNLITQGIEKIGGIHNSDILKAVLNTQKSLSATHQTEQRILTLLEEIRSLLLANEEQDKRWMNNVN